MAKIKLDEDVKGLFLHITTDTAGEKASALSRPSSSEIQVETVNPPIGIEFMDGDAFIYIVGNDIFSCMTSIHLSSLKHFLQTFLQNSQIRKDANNFEIHNAANADKVQLINSIGVSSVELKCSMFEASSRYLQRKAHVSGVISLIARHIKSIFGSENDVTDDGLKVNLKIDVDGRSKGKGIGFERISKVAKDVVNNEERDDSYVISLSNGEKITPKDILIRIYVEFDPLGKSIDKEHAWTELKNFYTMLKNNGSLAR